MKKMSIFTTVVGTFVMLVPSISFASSPEPGHAYDQGQILNDAYFDGIWLNGTIPYMNAEWSYGSYNKINYEFWYNIDGGSGDWVEMGYHTGAAWDQYSNIDPYSSYDGLFTAISQNGTLTVSKFPSKSWAQGQNHTFGASLNSQYLSTDMRADNQVVITYGNTTIGDHPTSDYEGQDYTNVGLEWVTMDSSPSYYVSGTPTMTQLNVHNSTGWHLWSEPTEYNLVKCSNTFYYAPYKDATYDKTTNTVTFG